MNKSINHSPGRPSQAGATLLIAMIFLVLLTLIVVSAIKTTNVNTKVVGNMQIQEESKAAAQQAIEAIISTGNFATLPTTSTVQVDINDSGLAASTYAVTVPAPTCISFTPVPQSAQPSTPVFSWSTSDQACFLQSSTSQGANSNCSNANWDISATATAPSVATTSTTTHQGIAIREMTVGTGC
ncbi:MAG TPA: pilus assembly PilX N-terminal domain-containing protein [Rhodanobacter sp.]|nr:pilus assembly PilX N-terminal domain-containing protein [Rhodanobacter sp.]